jgi:hypothetical protein
MPSSEPAHQPSRRKPGTGCPRTPRDGNVVCFFQGAQKFKTRYATIGFSDKANLDEGAMWPTTFALKELTSAEEARIGALVKEAVGWGLIFTDPQLSGLEGVVGRPDRTDLPP